MFGVAFWQVAGQQSGQQVASWKGAGALLEASWALLGASWALLGLSWFLLEAAGALLEASWALLGVYRVLGALGAVLEAS